MQGVKPMSVVKTINDLLVDLRRVRSLCDRAALLMMDLSKSESEKSERVDGLAREAILVLEAIKDEAFMLKQKAVGRGQVELFL